MNKTILLPAYNTNFGESDRAVTTVDPNKLLGYRELLQGLHTKDKDICEITCWDRELRFYQKDDEADFLIDSFQLLGDKDISEWDDSGTIIELMRIGFDGVSWVGRLEGCEGNHQVETIIVPWEDILELAEQVKRDG